jgi:hypothetical protein
MGYTSRTEYSDEHHKSVNARIDKAMKKIDSKTKDLLKFSEFGDEIFKTQIEASYHKKPKKKVGLSKEIMDSINGKTLTLGLKKICDVIEQQDEALKKLAAELNALKETKEEKKYI